MPTDCFPIHGVQSGLHTRQIWHGLHPHPVSYGPHHALPHHTLVHNLPVFGPPPPPVASGCVQYPGGLPLRPGGPAPTGPAGPDLLQGAQSAGSAVSGSSPNGVTYGRAFNAPASTPGSTSAGPGTFGGIVSPGGSSASGSGINRGVAIAGGIGGSAVGGAFLPGIIGGGGSTPSSVPTIPAGGGGPFGSALPGDADTPFVPQGTTMPSTSSTSSGPPVTVPEPGTLAIVAVGVAAMMLNRRRPSRRTAGRRGRWRKG